MLDEYFEIRITSLSYGTLCFSMQSFEEPKADIYFAISKQFEDFERRLTGELSEKLTERDNIYSTERRDYLQEIDALRVKATRIDDLEAENRKLNAELQEARKRHQDRSDTDRDGGIDQANRCGAVSKADATTENQTVDIEEYNRVKKGMIELERDYGKLVWARNHLDNKVRQQKATIREWKEYRENWILGRTNKRLDRLKSSSTRASPLAAAEQSRSSSAPAPPALPEGLTPLSGVLMSPSPGHNLSVDPEDEEYPHIQTSERASRDRRSKSHDTSIPQADREVTNADAESVTQATPDPEEPVEPIKVEPATNGSSPIIVYERSLKRRHLAKGRVEDAHFHKDEERNSVAGLGTTSSKYEQVSSQIQLRHHIRLNETHDSLDLDEVGGHLDTPRKRQRMAQERLKSSLIAASAESGEQGTPDDMITDANFQCLDGEHLEIENKQEKQVNTSTKEYSKLPSRTTPDKRKSRRDERISRQHAHNDRVCQRLEAAERESAIYDPPRSSSPTTDEPVKQNHTPNGPLEDMQWKSRLASPVVLQPRDANTSILPRTSDPTARRKRPCPPSRRDRGAACVPALAEDGEGLPAGNEAIKARRSSKDDQYAVHKPPERTFRVPPTLDLLGDLLNKPSPERAFLIAEVPLVEVPLDAQAQSKTPVFRSAHLSRSAGPATPRSLPAKKSELKHGPGGELGTVDFQPIDATIDRYSKSAQAVSRRTKNVPSVQKPSPQGNLEIRPEHEPLRARPVHRLGLQDFRLNPAHSDYAYNETVRKHDEKKTLSGCTDRHCQRCKGLRQYVTESGYKAAQKPGESQDEADHRLMQAYLGDNHHQLKTMSTKERSNLLIDAKVKEFANRYGSHRQAFPRSREPPGFWDLDFPTTQEAAENRAAADVMEREKVQERYWEATRAKGKWKFADE